MATSQRIELTSKLQALPSSTRTISSVISPNNGTTFNPNGDIISLTSGQGLVPNSLYLRYRATILKPTENGTMLELLSHPFSRLEVIIGNNVETIQNYNQVCNMVANCKLNYSQKTCSICFCILTTLIIQQPLTENLSSMGHQKNLRYGPLNCYSFRRESISSRFSPAVRIQLTTESLEQMFAFSTTGVNSFELKKFGTLL
jgi:hypothetical protein